MKKKFMALLLSLTLAVGGTSPMTVTADTEDSGWVSEITDTEDGVSEVSDTENFLPESVDEEKTVPFSEENDRENSIPVSEAEQQMLSGNAISGARSNIVVADSVYELASALNTEKLLNVKDGSTANGAVLQIWQSTGNGQQSFRVEAQGGGWYVIRAVHSDKVLDIEGASKANGAKVQQYAYNGTDAQLWKFEDAGDGYVYIRSKLGTCLDCKDGKSANGTIIQSYQPNQTVSQKWRLTEAVYWVEKDGRKYLYRGTKLLKGWQQMDVSWYYLDNSGAAQTGLQQIDGEAYYFDSNGRRQTGWHTIEGKEYYFNQEGVMQKNTTVNGITLGEDGAAVYQLKAVENGIYALRVADTDVFASVAGTGAENGARIELRRNTYNTRQQFEITGVSNGWYKIQNVNTGKVLDVQGASKANGAVLQQYTYNGSDAQLWQFIESGDGSCYILSKLGTCLDCPGGSKSQGTKLQLYESNNTASQKWSVEAVTQPKLLDVAEGTYQFTGYQAFGRIMALDSYSTGNSTGILLKSSQYLSTEQFQVTKLSDGWYKIVNKYSGKSLDIAGGNSKDGAVVQQYDYNGSYAQQWRFVDAGEGYCYIQSRLGTYLERKDGSTNEGTRIQTYTLNFSNAQKWRVESPKQPSGVAIQNGATYIITTVLNTSQVLDISGGSSVNGANVQLWNESMVSQQKFRIESVGDGWYKLVSQKSGKVLDVAGGSSKAGANLQQYEWNGSDAQKFRFIDAGNGYCYIQSKLETYLDCASGYSKNGTNIGMYLPNGTNAQKFRLDNVSQKNLVRSTILSDYTCRVTVYNPNGGNVDSVLFPTWSDANGQDDIRWLSGSRNADGSWSVVVDSADFKNDGAYSTHVYVKKGSTQSYVGKASYTLKKKIEGWVYIDGYRRYRKKDGTLMNDVSSIFNPSSKYITVDRTRGITTIYGYNSQTGKYDTPIKAMWCSVGNPISLTKPGTYSMGWQLRVKEMNASDGSYRCWAPYVSQIYGAVYFHGVSSDTPDLRTVSAGSFKRLGSPASHGCVRLAAVDARWIYYNTSTGTTIRIGDGMVAPMSPVRYQWVGGAVGPDPTYY